MAGLFYGCFCIEPGDYSMIGSTNELRRGFDLINFADSYISGRTDKHFTFVVNVIHFILISRFRMKFGNF